MIVRWIHTEAAFSLVVAVAAFWLQGCGDGESKLGRAATETCPAFTFGGNGFVAQARAGEVVSITCPTDHSYSGPPVVCSWVDRFCVAPTSHGPIDPDLCYNQYNLTLQGEGLEAWPEGIDPRIVPPPESGGAASPGGSAASVAPPAPPAADGVMPLAWVANASGRPANASQIDVGRRLARVPGLPHILDAAHLACSDEPYVDLDFENADVEISYGMDKQYPWSIRYKEVAAIGEAKVDLLITGQTQNISSKPSGKGSAMGRINLNTTRSIPFTFRFVHSNQLKPVVMRKVFFTLFDISSTGGTDLTTGKEITVSGFTEYFVSAHTSVDVTKLETSEYTFGRAQPFGQVGLEPADASHPVFDTQLSVKDLWLDSLNRSVVLMFRNTSEFSLSVRLTPGTDGRDFEFSGWSEVVSIGRKVFASQRSISAKYSLDGHWTLQRPLNKPWSSSGGLTVALLTSALVSFFLLRRLHGGVDADTRAAYSACSVPTGDNLADAA